MSLLASFFKGGDIRLGVFYPKDYLVAIFADLKAAQLAERRLLNSGFPRSETIAVSGDEVVLLAKEHHQEQGMWATLMEGLSRVFQTEAPYADHDVELASRGAGFLAVHCSSAGAKRDVWRLIEPTSPVTARYYSFGGIEHLVGEV